MENILFKPWHREPWVWFILGLLALTIIATSIMSFIAIQHTPAEIGARWYQEGILAKRERQQEAWVQDIHLQGEFSLSQTGEIVATIKHDPVDPALLLNRKINADTLMLYIEHPSNPELDQTIVLKKSGLNQYHGQITSALTGKRRLLISPPDDLWYLSSNAYFPNSENLVFLPH